MTNQIEPQKTFLSSWFETGDPLQSSPSSGNAIRHSSRPHIWRPPTDVYELGNDIIVRVEIAGMRENGFSISIQGRTLIIRGTRMDIPEKRAYYQMEIRYGEFSSEVELPGPVSIDLAQAEYKSGFLKIVLPKQEATKIKITDK